MTVLTELLEDLREYMEKRADADQPSGERPIPNEEMRLLMRIDESMKRGRKSG